MSITENTDNAIPIKAWDTVLFDKYCRFRFVLTNGLAAHSEELLRRRPCRPGTRVLDIGCGFGDTTQVIARQVGPKGAATGVDCAANFVKVAAQEAAQNKLANASFFVADVQADDLRGPYDFVFSRFGTMFFNAPVAALRNMRKALKPGGDLAMIVWRRREDNPWLHAAEQRVREIVPVVSHDETDQVHCGPGPFSMASADLVSDLLLGSGYSAVQFERCDLDICIGRDLEEAVEFAMALGPAGEIIRLAGAAGEQRRHAVVVALMGTLAPFARDDGIWAPSSTWLVSATA